MPKGQHSFLAQTVRRFTVNGPISKKFADLMFDFGTNARTQILHCYGRVQYRGSIFPIYNILRRYRHTSRCVYPDAPRPEALIDGFGVTRKSQNRWRTELRGNKISQSLSEMSNGHKNHRRAERGGRRTSFESSK